MTKQGEDSGTERPLTREERLAVQLRANLRRRKAQARAMTDGDNPEAGANLTNSASSGDRD